MWRALGIQRLFHCTKILHRAYKIVAIDKIHLMNEKGEWLTKKPEQVSILHNRKIHKVVQKKPTRDKIQDIDRTKTGLDNVLPHKRVQFDVILRDSPLLGDWDSLYR
jgi:hypothetical protein